MYLIEISNPNTAYVWDLKPEPREIVGIFSALDAKKVVRLLNRERYGESPPPPYKKPCKHRIIYRDVACRYIQVFGGKTQWVQTDVDCGYPILIDVDGEKRGMIDFRDRFPNPEAFSSETLSEMPF